MNYRDSFQPGARRYDVGERSNFALMPVAKAALRQILDRRVEEIAATLSDLNGYVGSEAARLGFQPVPSAQRGGHMIGLRSEAPLAADLPARLAAANIFVSVRGSSIRVSPHLYNTRADVDRFISALAKTL